MSFLTALNQAGILTVSWLQPHKKLLHYIIYGLWHEILFTRFRSLQNKLIVSDLLHNDWEFRGPSSWHSPVCTVKINTAALPPTHYQHLDKDSNDLFLPYKTCISIFTYDVSFTPAPFYTFSYSSSDLLWSLRWSNTQIG